MVYVIFFINSLIIIIVFALKFNGVFYIFQISYQDIIFLIIYAGIPTFLVWLYHDIAKRAHVFVSDPKGCF